VTSSIAPGRQSCQESRPAGGDALGDLAGFRQEMYRCLWRCPDALFELTDAVLTAGPVPSLPYLSLEPGFRRCHGMIYQALAAGGIDEEALRDLLVRCRPRDWPPVFAVDASTYPRPWAATSPDREWHHHSCPGNHGSDGAAVAGWAFQWLAQVSFAPDSWTAPQDQARVGAGADASLAAAEQILAHAARLRADGERRIPLYVMDAGYDAASVTADVRDHRVQVLVRLRNDRVLYRDPPPRIPGKAGRPRKHGSGTDRFECKNPASWGQPDQELSLHDERYGQVTVMSWGRLHPKLFCRGRFGGWAQPPVIRCHLIRVTVTRLPNGRAVPGPLWLWWSGPEGATPDLDLIWRAYLHRFDIEHSYRLAKHQMGWDKAALRDPEQVARWTWLIICAITQLRLARPIAEDHRQRWERRRRPGKLSPGRVRRDFHRLIPLAGTPASPPKPSKPGPGRPKGHTSTPATRHPVLKKAA
jgi:hypothetical protein